MRTWTTTTTVGADPVAVLDPTTGFAGGARDDPQACARWAPVAFDVSGLTDDRLTAGSRARPAPPAKPVVGGRLAGRSVGFDVHVGPPLRGRCPEAADGHLALSADGPVALDRTTGFAGGAPHDLAVAPGRSEVRASVGLRPRSGLLGRLLAEATAGLLAAGLGPPASPAVPRHAVSRMAREAVPC